MTRKVDADILEGIAFNRNFIKNGNAFRNAIGWATYADAAGTAPVDGTGGSPTVTWTRSGASPLMSPGSFRLTKDAANRQGEGASYTFTIDTTDQAKVMQIEFDYALISGTYSNANQDLSVWIYDITNSQLIQPSVSGLDGVITSPSNTYKAQFQTNANSVAYRLIIHVSTTSASAYTVAFDHVQVHRQEQYVAPVVTDWLSFTPTGSWSSNVTYSGRYRRVGDMGEFQVTIAATGGTTAATLDINLPTGLSIDTAKLSSSTATYQQLGYGNIVNNGGVQYYGVSVVYETATTVRCRFSNTNGGTNPVLVNNSGTTSNTNPITIANNDAVVVYFWAPIAGWSGQTTILGAEAARTVAMSALGSAMTGTIGASFAASTDIDWGSVSFDTHAGYAAGVYTVPVAGFYKVEAQLLMASTEAANNFAALAISKNGVQGPSGVVRQYVSGITNTPVPLSTTIQCDAGDTIALRLFTDATSPTFDSASTDNWFNVTRIAGPEAIGAGDLICGTYVGGGGADQVLTADVSNIAFPALEQSTGQPAFNGTVFTAPAPGRYRIAATVFQVTSSTDVYWWKNGVNTFNVAFNAVAGEVNNKGERIFNLVTGDTISLRPGGNCTTSDSLAYNVFQYERIG